MTCEMYFLLMPNLIVDSPGKHQSKGKALASGTFPTLEWRPSSAPLGVRLRARLG